MTCWTLLLVAGISVSSPSNDPIVPANPTVAAQADTVKARTRFELLHDASKFNYERWTNNVWGTVGFLVVVLGWLLTAKGARVFLSQRPAARWIAIAVAGIIATINAVLNIVFAYKSTSLQTLLRGSDYVRQYGLGPEHYANHEVRWLYAVVSDVLVLSLFFLILYPFWAMGSWKEPSEPKEPGSP